MIGRVISHYRILEKIGQGGMGVVYIAEDILLGRRVAVKSLTVDLVPGKQHYRARFLREARSASKLSHPHIASIYDYGETEDGRPFIVMELVEGKTLSDLLHDSTMTLTRAVEIIRDVAGALAEAHHHGIVHRDIKPSNVAINERAEVKVLDFGLAKQIDRGGDVAPPDPEIQKLLNTQTREGVVVGTPMYLSPEQALGAQVDERSDLFSLGTLLYECIAGKPAFSGSSPVEICAQVIRDDPPPPSYFNPRVPPELDRITLKALAKKADARYQSAGDLKSDLEAVQSVLLERGVGQAATRRTHEILPAGRISALSTLSDIFSRPRLPLGYALVGLLVAALVVWASWRMLRAKPHQPTTEAQFLFAQGEDALRDGTYYKARILLGRAVAADYKFALAHARLAEALIELDYSGEADKELLIVTGELVPERSTLPEIDRLRLDAVLATARRDLGKAVESYARIADLLPGDAHVYVDLGRAYEKNDETDRALASYAEAARRDPNNAAAFLRMGILHGRRQAAADAKAAFDRAETLYQGGNFEGLAEVAYQRALYNQMGKLDEARALLEKVLDITRLSNNTYQYIRALLELSHVAYSGGDTAQARQYATEAVGLARANHMDNLTTRGLHDLGYAFLVRRADGEAEQYFMQALEFAQRFRGRNNEARVNLSLGRLYIQREEPDRGLPHVEQALAFYREGGYRKEVSRCLIMLGRARLLKGDYKEALRIFDEQLRLARQVEDPEQVARSQNETGLALARRELYPEALRRYEESYAISMSLNNPLTAGHSLLNCADMLARLGRYEEARAALHSLPSIAGRLDGENSYKHLWLMWSHLIEGKMALSERRFAEAMAECRKAIALANAPQFAPTAAEARATLGLAQALSGARPQGKRSCAEALAVARTANDSPLLSNTLLASAEAALESGDAQGALRHASEAQGIFARTGRQESEWRARLIAALASKQVGDQMSARSQATRANDLLSELRKNWGTNAFNGYLAKRDIHLYRKQLDSIFVSP